MGHSTIASIAEKCNNAFTASLDSEPMRRQPDLADLAEAVEDERARFRVWAANIGVFAEQHASLDYRLRESERVRSLVTTQLEILARAQDQLSSLIQPKIDTEQDLSSSQSSTTSIIVVDSSDEGDESEKEEAIRRIRCAIDRLHRLAKAIRSPGVVSQASKASRYRPIDEHGIDLIKEFEYFSLLVSHTRFDGAPEFLHRRLSKANASRRRLFLFRKKHQEILSGRRHSSPVRRPSLSRDQSQTTLSKKPEPEARPIPIQITTSTPRSHVESHTHDSINKATSFADSKFELPASSRAASSVGGTSLASFLDGSRLPPPPKIPSAQPEFECPYCCQLMPRKVLSPKYWKQHLIKDLEPYVCLFEDCAQSDTKYRDQSAWVAHLRSHTMKWVCRLPSCIGDGIPKTFASSEQYAAHLREEHTTKKSLNKTQVDQLLKRQRATPDSLPIKSCPLCPITLADLGEGIVTPSARNKGSGTTSVTALGLRMQKHVASHLSMMASYSLPWLDDADGNVSSDKALSLSTERSNCSDSAGEQRPARIQSRSDISEDLSELIFEDHDALPDEELDPTEWDFIAKTPYEGQEFDNVLASFVRKYHVEMAFADDTVTELALPCTHMPLSKNTDFFGRDDAIQFLESHLCPTGETADDDVQAPAGLKTCALYGPAGIGKTQVAVEFVYRNMPNFDAVFWVHADEGSKIIEDVNRITVRLGLVEDASADSCDQNLTKELFKRWLGTPAKSSHPVSKAGRAKWLLILDHVIDARVLDDFWPVERKCGSILITSRRPMPWDPSRYPSQTLDPFSPEEGANFMCSLLDSEVSSEEKQCASLISSKVKGVPYALKHLTKWILGEGLSFAEFLSQNHTRENKRLQKRMKGELVRFVMDEDHSFLEAALESLQQSRPLLDVLSMLDPDNIPESLLKPSENTELRIDGFPRSEGELHVGLKELLKCGLVSRSPRTSTLFMHRIVQEAVRKQMSPLYARDVFNTCVILIASKWPFHTFTWRHGISRWPKCEEFFPHITRLRRHAPTIATEEYDLYGAFHYARLWCDCGWYCHERGMTVESDIFCGIAQRLCGELKNFYPLDPSTQASYLPTEQQVDDTFAEIHHNRGVIANESNRPNESLNYLLKFNEMMMKELGNRRPGNDMRLALSFNELGCAYMLRNDYDNGKVCFDQSIGSMEKLDNYERWQVSLPGVNLGVVYWLKGRYEDALEILHQGLRDREKKFGFNDRESFITGRFLYTLGNVYDSLQKYDLSLEYHQRALNHYRNTLGSGHHRTADTFVRIARHFMRLGQLREALELLDKAIQIYKLDRAFKAETARAQFWKSKVLRQKGVLEEASAEFEESVQIFKEYYGDEAISGEELQESDFDRKVVFWSR